MHKLALFLRLTAILLLLALPAVLLPYAWMNAVHDAVGMGILPDLPLVGYLTRSVSLLYAILGGVCAYVSLDVRRYLPLLRFSAWLALAFAAAMAGIDIVSGLPAWWTLGESVFLLAWAALLLWLVRLE